MSSDSDNGDAPSQSSSMGKKPPAWWDLSSTGSTDGSGELKEEIAALRAKIKKDRQSDVPTGVTSPDAKAFPDGNPADPALGAATDVAVTLPESREAATDPSVSMPMPMDLGDTNPDGPPIAGMPPMVSASSGFGGPPAAAPALRGPPPPAMVSPAGGPLMAGQAPTAEPRDRNIGPVMVPGQGPPPLESDFSDRTEMDPAPHVLEAELPSVRLSPELVAKARAQAPKPPPPKPSDPVISDQMIKIGVGVVAAMIVLLVCVMIAGLLVHFLSAPPETDDARAPAHEAATIEASASADELLDPLRERVLFRG